MISSSSSTPSKVVLTGKKEETTEYMSFSGYVGGEKYRKLTDVRAKKPEFIVMQAVKGMLPKNRLAAHDADQAPRVSGRRRTRTRRRIPSNFKSESMSAESSVYLGTGRRKTSTARVRIFAGSGKLAVNDRKFDAYFTHDNFVRRAVAPLVDR